MSYHDAIAITLLGMAVVFTGLILTALLIWSFSAVPRLLSGAKTQTPPRSSDSQLNGPPIPPEIMAVITAVLEVEKRLYGSWPMIQESLVDPEENQ